MASVPCCWPPTWPPMQLRPDGSPPKPLHIPWGLGLSAGDAGMARALLQRDWPASVWGRCWARQSLPGLSRQGSSSVLVSSEGQRGPDSADTNPVSSSPASISQGDSPAPVASPASGREGASRVLSGPNPTCQGRGLGLHVAGEQAGHPGATAHIPCCQPALSIRHSLPPCLTAAACRAT